jgi:hypothetical protein
MTGSFEGGLFFLIVCMALSSLVVFGLGLGDRERPGPVQLEEALKS